MKKTNPSLDEERIRALALELLLPIRENYVRGPVSRDRVYEALNALAFCTAHLVKGCGDAEALAWFNQALEQQFKTETENGQ